MKNLFVILSISLMSMALQCKSQDWVKEAPSGKKILVDNDHMRMVEVTILPGGKEPIHTHPEYIEYIIEPAKLLVTYPGQKPVEWATIKGKAYSGKPEPPHSIENIDNKTFKCILIEMKDNPYKKE